MEQQCETIGTWLFFIVYGSVAIAGVYVLLLESFKKIKEKIKEIETNKNKLPEIPDIPNGREFDRHFLSVMNKSKGIHKISDRDKKIMRLLVEQDEFERFREATKYIRIH